MLKLFKYLSKKDLIFMLFIVAFVVAQVALELTMPDFTQKLTTLVSDVIQNNKLKFLIMINDNLLYHQINFDL